jgi:hypothetical protein
MSKYHKFDTTDASFQRHWPGKAIGNVRISGTFVMASPKELTIIGYMLR